MSPHYRRTTNSVQFVCLFHPAVPLNIWFLRLQVESQLESKNKEFDVLAEQFKKETALRKKYKNELEDLKGIALRCCLCCAQCVHVLVVCMKMYSQLTYTRLCTTRVC
jgi:hypothetical protein